MKFSELLKQMEGKSQFQKCPSFRLYNYGPFGEDTRGDIPEKKGVYFAFEFDKKKAEEGELSFKQLVYIGKASADNTLRKRIGEHFTQHDLHYRETGEEVDMESIAFFVCIMDNDDEIRDVEAAEILKQQPPANSDGINHYIGETVPLIIFMANEFKMVDRDLYKDVVIVRDVDR